MRVLIADDHAAVRRSLTHALRDEPGIEVVGEAPDGGEAVRLTGLLKPDVVLMDVVMPQVDGIEATKQIVQQCPETRVIGLSVHDSVTYMARMLEAGACGYLLKDCNMEDLIHEILQGSPAVRRPEMTTKPRERVRAGIR